MGDERDNNGSIFCHFCDPLPLGLYRKEGDRRNEKILLPSYVFQGMENLLHANEAGREYFRNASQAHFRNLLSICCECIFECCRKPYIYFYFRSILITSMQILILYVNNYLYKYMCLNVLMTTHSKEREIREF